MEVGSMVSSQAVQPQSYAPRPAKEPQANNSNVAGSRQSVEGRSAQSTQMQSPAAQQQARTPDSSPSPQSSDTQRAQPPRPVVNAQGQKTGTIINTTA